LNVECLSAIPSFFLVEADTRRRGIRGPNTVSFDRGLSRFFTSLQFEAPEVDDAPENVARIKAAQE
jgi:hypothetical protein